MQEYRTWPEGYRYYTETTAHRMRQAELAAWQAGLTYTQMMENAGRAAAQVIQAQFPDAKTAAVWCGKGNNGGDGLVVARMLAKAGLQVMVLLAEGEPVTWDSKLNYRYLLGCGVAIADMTAPGGLEALPQQAQDFWVGADLTIDAICGIGLHGTLRGAAADAMGWRHHSRGKRIALDVPTGIDADTGEVGCSVARADLTITFHAPKPAHRLAPDRCGQVVVADIGIGKALGM